MTHLASSRGPVDVPAWMFTLEGYREQIARLSIGQDPPLFVTPESGPYRGDYQPTATATIAADGKTLAVTDTAPALGRGSGCVPHAGGRTGAPW